jgi:predicted transport protein
MDAAEKTMYDNIYKKSGKTVEEWVKLVQEQGFARHGEMMKFLKEEHKFTHGYANMIAIKATGTDARSAENASDLIDKQYKGKEHFRPVYEKLMNHIQSFGKDIEVAPKNAYVSLRRKKQFAVLQPATKTRFEIGINLKGESGDAILKPITTSNAMCSHKIDIASDADVTPQVLQWIKTAYEKAG